MSAARSIASVPAKMRPITIGAGVELHSGPVPVKNVEPFDKSAAARNITVTVSYTVVTAEGLPEGPHSCEALLTKRLWRGEDGPLVKQAAANPVRGVFTDISHMRHRRRKFCRLCEGPALAVVASGDHRRPAAEPIVQRR